MQGKKKFMNVLTSTELQQTAKIFRDENSCSDDIDKAGKTVLIALYGGKNNEELRFKLFQKSLLNIKKLLKNSFNLASLPPTTAAVLENSLRAYLQVELWSGFAKIPLDWKDTKHGLFPVTIHKELAPPAFFSIISCNCKNGVI
ncbi:hypothetical protein AVEN_262091-1 [Araneus ventricosus]|uniref:Uncharacterized protein n=1 Tax=Araneus ventricosus TaxID=182803 RepID=A0A4Y2TBK2_ARAVE|nr:hypothetical protein AVEN_262091-1 [Araneus ventricosus]